jgi:hypothetical protein
MSDIKKLCDEGDFLGAVDALCENIKVASDKAKVTYDADLLALAETLPAPQWTAVEKAISFGWTFRTHSTAGPVTMKMGKKKSMTIQEDGSYTRMPR